MTKSSCPADELCHEERRKGESRDYYTDNGAFDDDGMDRFISALERLMTIDEFTKFLKMWNELNK